MILKWKFKEALYGDDICLIDSELEAAADSENGDGTSDSVKARHLLASLTPTVILIQSRPFHIASVQGCLPLCEHCVCAVLFNTGVLWQVDLPSKYSYQVSKDKDQIHNKMGSRRSHWHVAPQGFVYKQQDWWNDYERGKNFPSSTLSTTNPTWNCLVLNPVLHVQEPLINSPRQSKANLAVKLLPLRTLHRNFCIV